MIKIVATAFLSTFIVNNVIALENEADILDSWGVKEGNNGEVVYLGVQTRYPPYWVSAPVPNAKAIDYSTLPSKLQPLIIYQR